MNRERFERLAIEAALQGRTAGAYGFGTLAEKRMHAVIKKYLCDDESFHEVGVEGTRFVSDIRVGNEIVEVQTGAFYPMKKKIAYYMEHTDCTVTVVHPIAKVRWMSWVEPGSMEIAPRRRVAGERAEQLLPELYCLTEHLGNPRLRFRLMLLETHDFRLLSGRSKDRKRGSRLYERLPLSLLEEIDFQMPSDFSVFLPADLPDHFTVKELSRAIGLRGRDAYSAARVLVALGLLIPAPPIGRAMAFFKGREIHV